jgi:cell division cycle 20, cofactor of APC complex
MSIQYSAGGGGGVDEDRFIPSRRNTSLDLCRRALLSGEKRPRPDMVAAAAAAAAATSSSSATPSVPPSPTSRAASIQQQQETPLQKEYKRRMLSSLCNVPLSKLDEEGEPTGLLSFRGGMGSGREGDGADDNGGSCSASGSAGSGSSNSSSSFSSNGRKFALRMGIENPFSHDLLRTMKLGDSNGSRSEDLSVAKKVLRKVPSAPFRILDAPDIVDDYYLNLISWGKDNILAVALAQSVYLWNAGNGEINHLVTLESPSDYVTSVSWCTVPGSTKLVAVGTNSFMVHLYDGSTLQKVRSFAGHGGRVSSLAWNQSWITSGARDGAILNHDVRASEGGSSGGGTNDAVVAKYRGHLQEVCGLKWNEEGSCLASGGNENFLCLWDAAMSGRGGGGADRSHRGGGGGSWNHSIQLSDSTPRLVLKKHRAAVKALDWCPFHRGLLASGGGTSDRTIKFWSASSGAMLNSIDTGSQVCSIIWSKHQRELCSSHGYSENQLILWKYPTMTRIKELPGHTARVLNMEISPDGASVVSAAADETLRFWNVFGGGGAGSSSYRKSSGIMTLLSGDVTFGTPTTTIR